MRDRGAWVETEREALLFGLLASVYANFPDGDQALDHLPPDARKYAQGMLTPKTAAHAEQEQAQSPR